MDQQGGMLEVFIIYELVSDVLELRNLLQFIYCIHHQWSTLTFQLIEKLWFCNDYVDSSYFDDWYLFLERNFDKFIHIVFIFGCLGILNLFHCKYLSWHKGVHLLVERFKRITLRNDIHYILDRRIAILFNELLDALIEFNCKLELFDEFSPDLEHVGHDASVNLAVEGLRLFLEALILHHLEQLVAQLLVGLLLLFQVQQILVGGL